MPDELIEEAKRLIPLLVVAPMCDEELLARRRVRTLLPELVERLERAEAVVEAARVLLRRTPIKLTRTGHTPPNALHVLSDALAALDNQAEGD